MACPTGDPELPDQSDEERPASVAAGRENGWMSRPQLAQPDMDVNALVIPSILTARRLRRRTGSPAAPMTGRSRVAARTRARRPATLPSVPFRRPSLFAHATRGLRGDAASHLVRSTHYTSAPKLPRHTQIGAMRTGRLIRRGRLMPRGRDAIISVRAVWVAPPTGGEQQLREQHDGDHRNAVAGRRHPP